MGKFLNSAEENAVREVILHAKGWGFGNLIHRLQVAWVISLRERNPDMSDKGCFLAAGFTGKDADRAITKEWMEWAKRYTGWE